MKVSYKDGLKILPKHNLVLTIGNEPFLRDQIINKVISLNSDHIVEKIDCEEIEERETLRRISYRGLFGSKRIIILKNFLKIKKLEYFTEKKFSDYVILDSDKSGRSKAFKELEKKALVIDCSKPKPWLEESDAQGKIIGFLKSAGLSITQDTALYLFNQIGYDLYKLIYEMKKLIIYKESTKSKEVTIEDINRICPGIHYNIFNLIDYIISNKKKAALELLDQIYKYEKSAGILLINLWYNHFEKLLYIKSSEKSAKELTTNIGVPLNIINNKLKPQADKLSLKKIIDSLNFLIETDFNIRKGSFDTKFYLEKFIVEF